MSGRRAITNDRLMRVGSGHPGVRRAQLGAWAALLCLGLLSMGVGPLAHAYEVKTIQNGGIISGLVTFKGAVPPPRRFEVKKDADLCGQDRWLKPVDVQDGKLKGAVIVLDGVEAGKPFPNRSYAGAVPGAGSFNYAAGTEGGLEIHAKQCNFGPIAGVLVPDAPMEFVNEDPVTHTVHTYAVFGQNGLIHRTVHNRDVRAESAMEAVFTARSLKQSRIVRLGCDRHDFMQNWLYVVDSPYFAITGSDGVFEIGEIPPGRYDVTVWHPELGIRTTPVTVTEGQHLDMSFDLSDEQQLSMRLSIGE